MQHPPALRVPLFLRVQARFSLTKAPPTFTCVDRTCHVLLLPSTRTRYTTTLKAAKKKMTWMSVRAYVRRETGNKVL